MSEAILIYKKTFNGNSFVVLGDATADDFLNLDGQHPCKLNSRIFSALDNVKLDAFVTDLDSAIIADWDQENWFHCIFHSYFWYGYKLTGTLYEEDSTTVLGLGSAGLAGSWYPFNFSFVSEDFTYGNDDPTLDGTYGYFKIVDITYHGPQVSDGGLTGKWEIEGTLALSETGTGDPAKYIYFHDVMDFNNITGANYKHTEYYYTSSSGGDVDYFDGYEKIGNVHHYGKKNSTAGNLLVTGGTTATRNYLANKTGNMIVIGELSADPPSGGVSAMIYRVATTTTKFVTKTITTKKFMFTVALPDPVDAVGRYYINMGAACKYVEVFTSEVSSKSPYVGYEILNTTYNDIHHYGNVNNKGSMYICGASSSNSEIPPGSNAIIIVTGETADGNAGRFQVIKNASVMETVDTTGSFRLELAPLSNYSEANATVRLQSTTTFKWIEVYTIVENLRLPAEDRFVLLSNGVRKARETVPRNNDFYITSATDNSATDANIIPSDVELIELTYSYVIPQGLRYMSRFTIKGSGGNIWEFNTDDEYSDSGPTEDTLIKKTIILTKTQIDAHRTALGSSDWQMYVSTFYNPVKNFNCTLTWFSGGSIEETEDHKFAVEWDSVAVGGKATPYDPTGYTENKTVVITAKGTLVEDDDLKYISFAGEGGPGKEAFDAIVNSAVGTRIEGVYNNNNYEYGATSGELKTTFEEKVPGELYYALFETESAGDTWMMALYNPDYDTYGLYQASEHYAGDASGDYPSWRTRVTGSEGKFTQQLESDSTTSEVWYSPERQELIVIPTQSVQDTYCSTSTGGVDLYGNDMDYVRRYAVLSTNKNLTSAPSKFIPEPGDTYAYNIIDDYYAYLSDAELSETDWSKVTATTEDVLPGLKFYDNTGTLVEGNMPLVATTAKDKNVKLGLTYYTWDGTTLVMHTGSGDFKTPSSLDGSPLEPDNIAFLTGTDIANGTPITYPIDMLDSEWLFTMQIMIDNKSSSVVGREYVPTGETELLDGNECAYTSIGATSNQGLVCCNFLKTVPNDGHRPLQMIPTMPSKPANRGNCILDISYMLEEMFPDVDPEVVRDAFLTWMPNGRMVHKTNSDPIEIDRRVHCLMDDSDTTYVFFFGIVSNTTAFDETNVGAQIYKGENNIYHLTDDDIENGVIQSAIDSRTYYVTKPMPEGGTFVMACCYIEPGVIDPSENITVLGKFDPSGCTDYYYFGEVIAIPMS